MLGRAQSSRSLLARNIIFNRNSNSRELIEKHLPGCRLPSAEDLQCITERQLGHKSSNISAVDKIGCRHGHPRAFILQPAAGTAKVHSGMLRLSCPQLVKAIDKFEASGGIERMNAELSKRSDLQQNFENTNEAWRAIKRDTISPDDKELFTRKFGATQAKIVFNSGLIGVSSTKDVKCLHAHVADEILRGENIIGRETLTILSEEGVPVSGCTGILDETFFIRK